MRAPLLPLLLACAILPAAETEVPWRTAADAPGYAAASAHAPAFSDRSLWPVTGKEAYLAQTWPKARLLVWAHPGRNGDRERNKEYDPANLSNWLEDGKPATRPMDENTDVLLPASDQPYLVALRTEGSSQVHRHLTVERNASFGVGRGDNVGRTVHGNVWIKRGGRLYAGGDTAFTGAANTFFRNDNPPEPATGYGKGETPFANVSQYFTINKTGAATVEFIGEGSTLDEFRVFTTMIVAPDSTIRPGRFAAPIVSKGGVIVLMDGARFGSWINNIGTPDLQLTDGTIQGGTPERPLQRPARWELHFKNHTASPMPATPGNKAHAVTGNLRIPSATLRGASALRSYSAAADGVLVVTAAPDFGSMVRPRKGSFSEEETIRKGRADQDTWAWYDGLPRGLTLFVEDSVVIDNVRFEQVRAGGLLVPNKPAWKNVVFGTGCAPAAELFTTGMELGKKLAAKTFAY